MDIATISTLIEGAVGIGVVPALLIACIAYIIRHDEKRDTMRVTQQREQKKDYRERENILVAESMRREEILRQEFEKREKIMRLEAEKRETSLMLTIEGYGQTIGKISDTLDGIKTTLADLRTENVQMKEKVAGIENKLERALGDG